MNFIKKLITLWKNRETLGDSHRARELAEFLPPALEIQKSPQNPIAKWLGRSLIVLFSLVILWACVGEVNIVASAEGKIIPSARVKKIQAPEKAVVKSILVKEGDYVKKGQALIELDSTLTQADKTRLTSELTMAQLNLQVDQHLITLLETHHSASKLKTLTQFTLKGANNKSDSHLYKQLLWQQWQQYYTQKQRLLSTLAKTKAEQESTKAVIKKLQQISPIINQRVNKTRQLLKNNFVSETEFMALEQERIENTQDLVAEQQRLIQLQAAQDEVQANIDNLSAQTHAQILTAIAESKRQIVSLTEELTKATDINAKQIIYAPVAGQVQQLSTHTIGGVVTVAEEIMLIVPDTQQLEVEVFLANNDIGFVHEGMTAEVKVHTFPFTKYGIIDAQVTHISDDATLDEQRGLIYGMHLLMNTNTIRVNKKDVKLIPGMAVTTEVQIGYRRIIEFFLAPLLRYRKEGLRER